MPLLKAALRADRELLDRQMFCRHLDAPLHGVDLFDLFGFGGHDAEHRDGAFADKAQHVEAPGAFAIVFQKQPLVLQLAKQLLCDALVVALAVPLRLHLAA